MRRRRNNSSQDAAWEKAVESGWKRSKLMRVICYCKSSDLARKDMHHEWHPRCPGVDVRRSWIEHGRCKNPDSWYAAKRTDARIYDPLLGISYVLDSAVGRWFALPSVHANRARSRDLEKNPDFRDVMRYIPCSDSNFRVRINSLNLALITLLITNFLFLWLNVKSYARK